jgi:hypothetical protein
MTGDVTMFENQQCTLSEHISCEMLTPEDQPLKRFVVPVEELEFFHAGVAWNFGQR